VKLYLQFGYGMMQHCRDLITSWKEGTVVLSPRDLKPERLPTFAQSITDLPGGRVLLDPQFYLPNADHERLCSHSYWPKNYQTGAFWGSERPQALLESLRELNSSINADAMILPGLLAQTVNDDWLATQDSVIAAAKDLDSDLPKLATIALSADATRDDAQVEALLEHCPQWECDGFYVVCEHPQGAYLVDDIAWLANVLDITAGLKLLGRKVILGYCNHQLLVAAAAKADAICSGTWMNVRSFPPDKFRTDYEEEIKRRSTWYYCPQALSEYKLTYLELANRAGVLRDMAPLAGLDGGYVTPLFAGAQPSSVGFSESPAFRHYLHALKCQIEAVTCDGFNDTVAKLETSYETADNLTQRLAEHRIVGQQRDFAELTDIGRAALSALETTRGPMLRRRWAAL